MDKNNYKIEFDYLARKKLIAIWLKIGVASLILSGVFSILLVVSRTPSIQNLIPFADFFYIALVIHVDLSVLIWFISFAGLLWTLVVREKENIFDKLSIYLVILGMSIIVIVPFLGVGSPLMNNYIPVLDHPAFMVGLIFFGLGALVQIVRTLLYSTPSKVISNHTEALRLGIYLAAIVALISIVALLASYISLSADLDPIAYYEVLFWGFGHILQFTHTILLLVAWVWIAGACGATFNLSPKMVALFLIVAAAPVVTVFYIYMQHDVLSAEFRYSFTKLMKYGGLASIPLGFYVVLSILFSKQCSLDKRPVKAALISSIILFAVGGIVGFMIEGANVVIPAHYHGSIVGITLAFMGLAYHLLPSLGFTKPTSKLACWQPYIYAVGQLLHIAGLAWSGGYGVQRKVTEAIQGLDHLPEIAGMALMGAGGGISIIGGILFLVIMLRAFMKKDKV